METITRAYPQILLTDLARHPVVPRWMERFSPQLASPRQVRGLARLPELTVVQAKAPKAALARRDFLSLLASQHLKTPVPAKIVFLFEGGSPPSDAQQLLEVLSYFERTADVELACGSQQAAFALDAAFAKIWAHARRAAAEPKPADPLAKTRSAIAATADLRGDSGKLSAEKIAGAFGLPVAELARLLGRNRQTVSKSPEAAALQPSLASFERVARLRAVLARADFLRWLNMPNEQLDGSTPFAVIGTGQVEAVADLVEDMLSGSST